MNEMLGGMQFEQTDDVDVGTQNTEQLRMMKAEVDALQVHVMGAAKPWYRQASTLIAILALVFSFGTTFVSYTRTKEMDRHAALVELRSLMQRIVAIPRESFELTNEYEGRPIEASQMAGFINNENLILTQQAVAILNQIPDLVSGADYYAIGQGFLSSGENDAAIDLFEHAAQRATTATTAVAAYRSLGAAGFIDGQFETGRIAWREAMDIFTTRFADAPISVQHYTHAFTMMRWAQYEAAAGECDAATELIRGARRHSNTFAPVGSEPLLFEMQQTEEVVSNCATVSNEPKKNN